MTRVQHADTGSGNTKHDAEENQPRLPHERDESDDSQHSGPRKIVRQAYDDVQSGQQDTDLHGSRGERVDTVPKNR